MKDQLPFPEKLAYNIGLIVLESQELERQLKFIVAVSSESTAKSANERHENLRSRPLGEVVKQLIGNTTCTSGSIDELEAFFRSLLDRRNKVVHHFSETYGDDLKAGRHSEILASLAQICIDLRQVARSFRSVNLDLAGHFMQEQEIQADDA